MPKYLVKKELPQGQKIGTVVDLNEAIGDVFLLVGAVEKIEPFDTGESDDALEPDPLPVKTPTRGRYRRSDLQAN